MIHVLTVGAVEEAELLLAVSGIVGGVEIKQDLAALANLVATETDELLAQQVVACIRSRAEGAFSQRLSVGCEPSASPSF